MVSPSMLQSGRLRFALLGALGALALACAAHSKTGEPAEGETPGNTGGREVTGGGGGSRTGGKGAEPTGGAGAGGTQQPTGGTSGGGAMGTGGSMGTSDAGTGAGTGGSGGLPPVTGQSRKVSTVQQFDQAVAASKPGDEIVFANGTYS